jgi:hypothetical protein
VGSLWDADCVIDFAFTFVTFVLFPCTCTGRLSIVQYSIVTFRGVQSCHRSDGVRQRYKIMLVKHTNTYDAVEALGWDAENSRKTLVGM